VVEYLRNGNSFQARESIGAKSNESSRINSMDHLGRNSLSRNTDTFQTVIQSDILVEPEECGSPIFSLQGQFIGIAISDAGRNKSYILPAHIIEKALREKPDKVSKPELASQTITPRTQMRNPYSRPNNIREIEEIRRMQREQMERFFQESQNPGTDIFEEFDGLFDSLFGR